MPASLLAILALFVGCAQPPAQPIVPLVSSRPAAVIDVPSDGAPLVTTPADNADPIPLIPPVAKTETLPDLSAARAGPAGDPLAVPAPTFVPSSQPAVGSASPRPALPAPTPSIPPTPRPVRPPLPPTTRQVTSSGPAGTYTVIGQPEIVAAALLQVNDQFITLQQVMHPLHRKLKTSAAGGDQRRFRQEAMDLIADETRNQIEQTLLMAEAENRLNEEEKKVVQEELDSRVRQATAEVGGSRLRLDALLRDEGTDLASWEQEIRRALMVSRYSHKRFGEQVSVSRRQLWEYYQTHKSEFITAESLQMQIISCMAADFLPRDRRSDEAGLLKARQEAKAQIEQARDALAAGDDFAAVAKKLSKGAMASSGGVWPVMARGSFRVKDVENAAFEQKVGQVSGIIETPEGFTIVKTLARTAKEEMPFEKVQDRIEAELRRQQYRRLTSEYLQTMQSKTVIQRAARFEEDAVEAAARKYLPED